MRLTPVGYLAAALPWGAWYGAILLYERALKATRDPAGYDGTCERMNGLRVPCSLEQWLTWDANGWSGLFMFAGALVAAAVSGAIIVAMALRRRRGSTSC